MVGPRFWKKTLPLLFSALITGLLFPEELVPVFSNLGAGCSKGGRTLIAATIMPPAVVITIVQSAFRCPAVNLGIAKGSARRLKNEDVSVASEIYLHCDT